MRIAPRNQAFLALNLDLFHYSCSLLSVSERWENTVVDCTALKTPQSCPYLGSSSWHVAGHNSSPGMEESVCSQAMCSSAGSLGAGWDAAFACSALELPACLEPHQTRASYFSDGECCSPLVTTALGKVVWGTKGYMEIGY